MKGRWQLLGSLLFLILPCILGAETGKRTENDDVTHLRYFGYYWSNITLPETVTVDGAEGKLAQTKDAVNYSDEMADHTNIVWIVAQHDYKQQLEQARQRGQVVILDVARFFFYDPGKPQVGPILYRDYAGAKQRFRDFWESEIMGKYDDVVKVIYPMDEPYHHFVNAFFPWSRAKEQEAVYNHLIQVGHAIKSVAPTVKLALTFDPVNAMDPRSKVPPNYDWAGYYFYDDFDNCQAVNAPNPSKQNKSNRFAKMYEAVENKLTDDSQRIYLIPPCFQRLDKNTIAPMKTREKLLYAYRLAASREKTIMITPFLWRSFTDGKQGQKVYRGAREIPELQLLLKEMGQAIIHHKALEPQDI